MRAVRALFLGALLWVITAPAQADDAKWITHPQATAPSVIELRRDVILAQRPKALWVDVSADNRFILYVNGARVAAGPATSDLAYWRYSRVNIAPYLKVGPNSLAAVVWNFVIPNQGDLNIQTGPLSQQSAGTGFYLKVEDEAYANLNSGPDWKTALDRGHTATSGMAQIDTPDYLGYYVAGAPETIDAAKSNGDWRTGALAADWLSATPLAVAPWTLSADPLPAMTFQQVENGQHVRGEGIFPAHGQLIGAHSHVQILIRRSAMVAAYPQFSISGGKGAVIKVTYAEALYDKAGKKGVRDVVEDRQIRGLTDTFIADGQARSFEPLHWRVWRYLQLDITTGDSPLSLESLKTFETGYPFTVTGAFQSSDPDLNQIWQIGWRTARIDAHETYMDSAYWEQLQYVGDTRIQALISYAVSGDARLAVNAIDAFSWSNSHKGLTEGAYPSRGQNPIAPFSLLWIGMMHDYWMNQSDTAVLTRNLPRAREVLGWFKPYLRADGLLGRNPTWNFVDWVGKPREAFPSFDKNDESCLTTLNYLGALQQAADLETALSDPKNAEADTTLAETLKTGIRTQCWDASRGLFADDPSKTLFSQHTNALAVLYDVAAPADQAAILGRITAKGIDAPNGLIPVSYYFSWYLVRAYAHAGLADHYPALLQTWRDLLPLHFTTWPEDRTDRRSDTHAWSGHPTVDMLTLMAGVEPATPGYATVRVAPHLGDLKYLHARVMTPSGPVAVDYVRDNAGFRAIIRTPNKLTGTFVWLGKSYQLTGNLTNLNLPAY